jgi:protein-S-isoprenylcysteine O-methyltransferase Ste14
MAIETTYRLAFFVLLGLLLIMRVFFMIRVRLAGERILPNQKAVEHEGGLGAIALRALFFFALLAFLVMYFLGAEWINKLNFRLPAWIHWLGFGLGITSVFFWTWTQIHLDTQWSAQLQLTRQHRLVTSGPYAHIRHPLYLAMFGWCAALVLLTANWVFVGIFGLSIAGVIWRVPKEEQMMLDAFGEKYQIYMERTGRFIPKLHPGNQNDHT